MCNKRERRQGERECVRHCFTCVCVAGSNALIYLDRICSSSSAVQWPPSKMPESFPKQEAGAPAPQEHPSNVFNWWGGKINVVFMLGLISRATPASKPKCKQNLDPGNQRHIKRHGHREYGFVWKTRYQIASHSFSSCSHEHAHFGDVLSPIFRYQVPPLQNGRSHWCASEHSGNPAAHLWQQIFCLQQHITNQPPSQEIASNLSHQTWPKLSTRGLYIIYFIDI